jgi:hypothetical protein
MSRRSQASEIVALPVGAILASNVAMIQPMPAEQVIIITARLGRDDEPTLPTEHDAGPTETHDREDDGCEREST